MILKSIVDCHTHSSFSPDSNISVYEGARAALNRGLGGITFTDHVDLDNFDHETGRIIDYRFDVQKHAEVIDQARRDFDGRLKILNGVEIGFRPHLLDTLRTIISDKSFDFILCSVHIVDRASVSSGVFYGSMTKEQAYTRYLEEIYASVVSGLDFDVVGHIGYICRYAPYTDRALAHKDYSDILDSIFKKLIEQGKGIEVNTAGLTRGLGYPHPEYGILKRYKECGGQILTIGSDGHDARAIGGSFETVLGQLRDIGFTYVTYFEKRKPIFVKIS